jgi:hypothetical protein
LDPVVDVVEGQFVLLRPSQEDIDEGVPVWLGRVVNAADKNKESPTFNHILVEYWVPQPVAKELRVQY